MISLMVSLGLALALGTFFLFMSRSLACPGRQFIATMPRGDISQDGIRGTNLTTYGALIAMGLMAGATLMVFLLGTTAMPMIPAGITCVSVLSAALISARTMAKIIERKRFTFTVGGAFAVCLAIAPWLAACIRSLWIASGGSAYPLIVLLTALALAYVLGEAIGRLACLSFGCCYGRPLADLPPRFQRLFRDWPAVFTSPTHKAVYESGFRNEPLIPVQLIAAAGNGVLATIGLFLFLETHYKAAFLTTAAGTQLLRFGLEYLRADYRGAMKKVSPYQILSLSGIPYVILVAMILDKPAATPCPVLSAGAAALWTPAAILLIQGIGLVACFYFGISRVTTSTINFGVRNDRV